MAEQAPSIAQESDQPDSAPQAAPKAARAPSKIDETAQAAKGKRAHGIFPRMSLTRALELPVTIYEMGEGEPVRRLSVFHKLGRKPDSGTSRTLIAVCNTGYGLTTGGATADRMALTERGKAMVAARDEATRLTAAYDALFSNEIFAAFMKRFQDRSMPNNEVARDYLQQTFSLQPADATALFDVIAENVTEYGLIQELSGRQVLVSREIAMDSIGTRAPKVAVEESNGASSAQALAAVVNPQGHHVPTPQAVSAGLPSTPNRVEPQIHFNIQIQLPENAASETYNTIFKNIAVHLLGRCEE